MDDTLRAAAEDYTASLIDLSAMSEEELHYLGNLQEVADPDTDDIDCDLYDEVD